MKKILFFILLPILSTVVLASSMYIPAVKETEFGYQGVLATLEVDAEPGEGHVFVDTLPLTKIDIQASARLAKEVSADVLKQDLNNYNLFYIIRSESPIIGGPSAGGAMAATTIATLLNLSIDKSVTMTGTINPDGTIGPVGGILEKIQAAAEHNISLFLIPSGQRIITVRKTEKTQVAGWVRTISKSENVDVVEYAKNKWGTTVKEVSNVEDALRYLTGYKIEKEIPKITKNKKLENAMKDMSQDLLSYAKAKLEDIDTKKVPYQYENDVNTIIKNIRKKITEADKLFAQGNYYSTSSYAFVASVNTEYVKNLINVLNSDSKSEFLDQLISEEEEKIKTIEKELKKEKITNSVNLEIVSTAIERLEDAKINIKDAWKSFYNKDYQSAIYFVSYASERKKTAESWISLKDKFASGNEELDVKKLKPLAERRLEDAISAVTYAQTIGIEIDNSDIELAKNYYDKEDYMSSLFKSISAKAETNLAMELRGLDKNEIKNRIPAAEQKALKSIEIAESYNATPILAISYLEYAKTFVDSEPQTALKYYKYSNEFAKLSKSLLEAINQKIEEPKEQIRIKKTGREKSLSFSSLIVGFMIGAFVGYGYKQRKKYRK
ncbi:MAG: hypothetical protein J7J92_02950 [Candidatus Aenigmarchaeota archaeon]|nr:hypothetical protein [Candidatus Aenigmarchaeota archaeon]